MTAAHAGHTGRGGTAAADLPPDLANMRRLARHQVMGLTGTFLLGMAVNLPGMPSGTGAAIGVTVTAGILTLLTSSNWWSYAMAAGFAAALLTYASLLVQAVNARAPGLPE